MADGMILSGQEYDRRHHILLPFTEQMKEYTGPDSLRVTGTELVAFLDQTPFDYNAAKDRQYDVAAIRAEAIALPPYVTPAKVKVDLPDRLNSVTVTFNKTSGTGLTNYPASNQAAGISTSGSASFDIRAEAEASAAILPSVVYDIDKFSSILVNAKVYTFYQDTSTNLTTCIAVIAAAAGAAITNLPIFQQKQHQLKLFGQQVSLRAGASTRLSVSYNNDTPQSSTGFVAYGDDYSEHVGVDNRIETIPYTIHGAITISSNTDTKTVTVTVKADTVAVSGPGSANIAAITNEPTPITLTANGSVTPNTLSATTPANIPVTGLYLVDISGQSEEFGLTLIRAVVVDMSQYA